MDMQKVSKNVTKERWKRRIKERVASGLPVARWCEENSINTSTYYYWLKIIRQDICETAIPTDQAAITNTQFVAIPPVKHPEIIHDQIQASVSIQIGNSTISINNNVSPELLSMLIGILKC